ncbi:hypothetical protein PISL3812_05955 [Talaromyces islandicus]|uniref:PH domain-containing protein n=1 Tax=Talaromyces islandicus TaxID=28573 RepID=A0A0U1M1J6_TALIS|nr:hypothetical protein PISL3812_05955 [Talaromyces islandicus]
MDAQPAPRSGIPRRGPPLAPIRTDLSQQHLQQQQKQQLQQPQKPKQLPVLQKPRPQRLRPAEPTTQPAESVPLQPDPAKRKPSKSSLRSLFSRNKALRDVKKTDSPLPQVGERRESDAQSIQPPETPRSFTGTVTSVSTVVASTDLSVPISTPTEPTFNKKGPSSQTAKVKPARKTSSPWVPPPLFQAYPQALKHATVSAPILSADAILRIQSSKTTTEAKEEKATAQDPAAAKKKDEKDKKHARRTSVATGDTLLAKKIFVLVTSGRLLQYAAEGRHDRLPEKLMRLGSTSAAFASDAIPGKPYVIQVTQQFSDDGKAPPETSGRGLLSRFGIQGSDARRMVRTFLMVLSEPEEMNSWLVSLRMAIETVGGKHFVPESPVEGKNAAAGKTNQAPLSARASRQLNIRRPSLNEFSQNSGGSSRAPSRNSIAPALTRKNSNKESTPSSNLAKALSRRSITAPSDAISIATTATTSMEPDTIYEDPRDAPLPPTRNPNISSQPPSVRPSPATSPVQSPPTTPQLRNNNKPTFPSSAFRPIMYAASPPQPDHQKEDAGPSRRSSYIASSHSPPQSPSPTPPNFSVPSFSTRFAISRRGSEPSVTSDNNDTPTDTTPAEQTEPRRKYSGLNIDMGRISASNLAKRSLAGETASHTPSPLSPTKSSMPGPRGIPLHTTPSQPSLRYAHRAQPPPEPSQKASPSDTRAALLTPQKSRPLMRLPKHNEPDTLTALPGFAQSAPGTDRIKRTSVATATPSRPPSQILPPSHQTPRIPGPGGQRASRMAVPASKSPPIGNNEQPSRRLSALPQQTSPRKMSLSMSPPAPPPNCPLPEVPSDISARRIPTWRKQSLLPSPNVDARRQQSPELRQMGFARRQQISPPTTTTTTTTTSSSSIPHHDSHGL